MNARPSPPATASEGSAWSWRLGSLAGIPVYVHASFTILLAWVALSHLRRGEGTRAMAGGILFTLCLFGCVLLHELGHALMARRFGVQTRDITLLPIGGVARLESMPERPAHELWVALAGPAVNVVIALVLMGVLAVLHGPLGPEGLQVASGPFLTRLFWVNVGLAVFNLLPAFPMDGGRVLRAALAMRLDRTRATDLAARVGQGMALLFGMLGLAYNPTLVLIAVFVWMGARAEASMVHVKSALHGMQVSQAMITDFRTLSPDEPLAHAVNLTLASFQQDFPVVEADHAVGVVTHADVLRGLSEGGPATPVGAVMQREFAVASPNESLDAALARLQASPCRAMLVVRGRALRGMVTPDNVAELLTMARAVESARAAHRT